MLGINSTVKGLCGSRVQFACPFTASLCYGAECKCPTHWSSLDHGSSLLAGSAISLDKMFVTSVSPRSETVDPRGRISPVITHVSWTHVST